MYLANNLCIVKLHARKDFGKEAFVMRKTTNQNRNEDKMPYTTERIQLLQIS
jgi:hypothetical protein